MGNGYTLVSGVRLQWYRKAYDTRDGFQSVFSVHQCLYTSFSSMEGIATALSNGGARGTQVVHEGDPWNKKKTSGFMVSVNVNGTRLFHSA